MRAFLRRGRKAVGTLLGGATGAAVVVAAEAFEVDVDPTLAGAIAVILAALGTWLAPKNEDPSVLVRVTPGGSVVTGEGSRLPTGVPLAPNQRLDGI